jgi:hypothetical protein
MIKGLIASALLTTAAGAGISTVDLPPPDLYDAITESGIELPALPERPDFEALRDMTQEERDVMHEDREALFGEWLDLVPVEEQGEFQEKHDDRQERHEEFRAELEGMDEDERRAFMEEHRQERRDHRADREEKRSERGERHSFAS